MADLCPGAGCGRSHHEPFLLLPGDLETSAVRSPPRPLWIHPGGRGLPAGKDDQASGSFLIRILTNINSFYSDYSCSY